MRRYLVNVRRDRFATRRRTAKTRLQVGDAQSRVKVTPAPAGTKRLTLGGSLTYIG
jgi:hypothetical protein